MDRRFDGFYGADKGKHTCEVSGTITDDKIAWAKTRGIKGGMLNEIAMSWSGMILRDRIDIRCEHLTPQGQPARVNGFQRMASDEPRYTTQEVLDHVRAVGQE
jgi:hypothetical protein